MTIAMQQWHATALQNVGRGVSILSDIVGIIIGFGHFEM
jgi:hypothetical protein